MRSCERLLEAVGEIDPELVREAERMRRRRPVWAPLAACGAAAAVLAAVLLWPGPGGEPGNTALAAEEFRDVREVSELYGGELLAENLAAAGAEVTGVRLTHREDRDVADTSGWDTLTLTGELAGEPVVLSCGFNDREESGTGESFEYNGVAVTVTEGTDPEVGEPVRVIGFTLEGVRYELTVRGDGEVTDYLDMVLFGKALAPEGAETETIYRPFESLMGFEDYRVTVEQQGRWGTTWHFWLTVDGQERCVAETFGLWDELGAWSADLDGDGVPEVVTNNMYEADGVREVLVYRYDGERFYEGSIDRGWYQEIWPDFWMYGATALDEWYDPETGVFWATLWGDDGERKASFTGTEHLTFREAVFTEGEHMARGEEE